MPVPALVIGLFACDLLMGVLAAVGLLASTFAGVPRIDLFRLGQENNLPTWYSSSQLLLVAFLFGALAWHEWRHRGKHPWALAAASALLTFLSLDEAATVHEQVGHMVEGWIGSDGGLRTGIWFLIWLPLVLAMMVPIAWGLRHYLRGRRTITYLYGLGLSAFALSAVGLEALSNLSDGTLFVLAETFIEELGEMCAVTVVLWATLLLLDAEGLRLSADGDRPRELDD